MADNKTGADAATWARTRAIRVDSRKLEGSLIPIVADLTAQPSANSSIKAFDGKIPSIYLSAGPPRVACGLTGSLKTREPATVEQVDEWQRAAFGPYNIGVLSRTLRAFDVDVEDAVLADEIGAIITSHVALILRRTRAGSPRFLLPFLLNGEQKKRVIKTRAGKIEFLGDGEQWVFAGTHKSGARLEWQKLAAGEWNPGQPVSFTRITPEQFEALWQELHASFAVENTQPATPKLERTAAEIAPSAEVDELRRLLIAKDFAHQSEPDWWKDLARISHETSHGDDGLALAIELSEPGWNASGTSPYASCADEVEAKWAQIGGRNPTVVATVGSLRRDAVADDDAFGPPVDQDVLAQADREAHATRLARFKWKPLDDYANEPPPKWLIKKILPEKPLNMLYGPSGAGKSAVTLDMALAITRGIPWRGLNVRQGPVCWFAAEAEGSMRNRSLAYRLAHKLSSLPDFYVIGRVATLTDREAVRALAESAKVHSPVLIVVDTLAASSGGANENSAEDMGPVLDNCVVIHEITKASVLLVHHSGKSELAGARGWSGIKARVDAEIEVKKGDNDTRTATPDKMRDGEEGRAFTFKLAQVELGLDEDGDKITSVVVEHVDDRSSLEQHNATRKGQGKYHKAIRRAILDAPNMRLDGKALVLAAVELVPEDKRPATADKQVVATINQMVDLGQLRLTDGEYEFTTPPIRGNPDREHVEQLLADADADLL